MPQTILVQVKAFGDLVIACAIADRVAPGDRNKLGMLVGNHLRELCEAMRPGIATIEIDVGETGVPSIFDVRKNGVARAARSALHLRRAIAKAPLLAGGRLVFERVSARERFIAGPFGAVGFAPGTANIYQGYIDLLADAGIACPVPAGRGSAPDGPIGVFPGSRIAAKNLSSSLVCDIMTVIERGGSTATLFLLEGERPDLEQGGLPHVIVPRQFAAMLATVRSVRLAITADSMPAHMAEANAVPVFVFSPRANEYWLPQSAYEGQRWDLFSVGVGSARFAEMVAAAGV